MKVILFSIFVTFVIFEVVNSSEISIKNEKVINGLKNTTQLIIEKLKQFEEKMHSDMKIKINQSKLDSLNRMDGIVYYVLHGVETAVSAVNVTGIDASSCQKMSNNSLRKLNETTYLNLDKCTPISLSSATPLLKNITKALQVANKTITDLNNIVATCSLDKATIPEKCVINKIEEFQISNNRQQNIIFKLKNEGLTVLKNVKISAKACQSKFVYDMRVEATFKVYRDANLCIRSIYKSGLYKILL
ncbi:uncharacterized protein LOC122507283 [Leptopilina heterotoma]|uniref:uncharacterized protein LOC122507283 n=1 Tax=Leptopilina heterotoma TaxID=63436 RepID=UPI001CA88726|nr:uncharacterized protein LOC122507283 [Leptopilina heterotoma]